VTTSPTSLDLEALKHRYADERAKRLRPDGNDQYVRIAGQLSHYVDDPYVAAAPRAAVHDHVTVACVGAGFAGLVAGARLVEAGVGPVRLVDKAGDVGGTWYWNRYPGAQCDTASFVYMPLLEETGHMPTEKYAHAPEILEHCRQIASRFGLYDHALFHTEVTGLVLDEDASRWRITTNRGDEFTATYVVLGTGPLHVPKLPGIEGIDTFAGHSFHTSRWDYAYTGGDPFGAPMDRLADRRVAVIGTGATAVQCVPHLARDAAELYVFQRTPSSVDVRGNRPTDPEWFAGIATPGWQGRWMENFALNQSAAIPEVDLVDDGWTDIARRIREKILALEPGQLTVERMLGAFEESDFEKMEEIRARVDAVVEDRATASNLKAWYRQLCKRPCFHDEYLEAFNRPTTHLVDTDGRGVEAICERGVVANGQTYEVDCIVFASGFEVGTPFARRAGFDLVGLGGRRLSEEWADGMVSLHGIHVEGFPNAFFVQLGQAGNLISNVPHNLVASATTVATIVGAAAARGCSRVEVSRAAQDAWMELLASSMRMLGTADCTPGYYNNEGHPDDADASVLRGYPEGAAAFFSYLEQWRTSGEFEGLVMS
jgi:cation diffusion facilitator CzcD-associated flavoprotein CzcO